MEFDRKQFGLTASKGSEFGLQRSDIVDLAKRRDVAELCILILGAKRDIEPEPILRIWRWPNGRGIVVQIQVGRPNAAIVARFITGILNVRVNKELFASGNRRDRFARFSSCLQTELHRRRTDFDFDGRPVTRFLVPRAIGEAVASSKTWRGYIGE